MNTRRSAREQSLPEEIARILNSHEGQDQYIYCRDLYEAGWTLRAIGEALSPNRARSTVRSWVERVHYSERHFPVPEPLLRTPEEYVPKKPVSPGIPAADLTRIQDLAPIARKYRAGMSPLHVAALANQDLTILVRILHDRGVPVQELADAANVTYRAMSRRLGKVK